MYILTNWKYWCSQINFLSVVEKYVLGSGGSSLVSIQEEHSMSPPPVIIQASTSPYGFGYVIMIFINSSCFFKYIVTYFSISRTTYVTTDSGIVKRSYSGDDSCGEDGGVGSGDLIIEENPDSPVAAKRARFRHDDRNDY